MTTVAFLAIFFYAAPVFGLVYVWVLLLGERRRRRALESFVCDLNVRMHEVERREGSGGPHSSRNPSAPASPRSGPRRSSARDGVG